jgi:heme/copper-type cytochrome/quinol oxidase subunit 3
MPEHIETAGFGPPVDRLRNKRRAETTFAHLAATIALVLSTLTAATAVARADVATNVIDNEGSLFAIALFLGLFFIGIGSLTVVSLPHHPRYPKTRR